VSTIDFQALIPRDLDASGLGIHIDIDRGACLTGGESFFTAEIVQLRTSTRGRPLNDHHVITICGDPDASLPDLLRALAELFEQEQPVTVGTDERAQLVADPEPAAGEVPTNG